MGGHTLVIDFASVPGWGTLTCTQRSPAAHVKCRTADRAFAWDSASTPDGSGAKSFTLRVKRPTQPLVALTPPVTVNLRKAGSIELASTPPGCVALARGGFHCG